MSSPSTDVLVLNTAVLDLRSRDFDFVDRLVGAGGLAKCETRDMPSYSQEQIKGWIDEGGATAGGPGNTAPLLAHAGLRVAVGGLLGHGACDGLDIQGRTFHDILAASGVDMSATIVHPSLPTGTTFIHTVPGDERGGIAYFPNANNEFDFELFKPHVQRLRPKVVYYMYSGLSDRGDANGGRDLADFVAWCGAQGCITIVDSHTLCAEPEALIKAGTAVDEYRLLEPLLPQVDVFFTSWDEARMISATLGALRPSGNGDDAIADFLRWLAECYASPGRSQLFGVTVRDGAVALLTSDRSPHEPHRVRSRFMCGDVVDLVGAGDSFRAGLVAYLCQHAEDFRAGRLNVEEAVQMGNLMAALYVTAPINDRYGNMRPAVDMLRVVRENTRHDSPDDLPAALSTS